MCAAKQGIQQNATPNSKNPHSSKFYVAILAQDAHHWQQVFGSQMVPESKRVNLTSGGAMAIQLISGAYLGQLLYPFPL